MLIADVASRSFGTDTPTPTAWERLLLCAISPVGITQLTGGKFYTSKSVISSLSTLYLELAISLFCSFLSDHSESTVDRNGVGPHSQGIQCVISTIFHTTKLPCRVCCCCARWSLVLSRICRPWCFAGLFPAIIFPFPIRVLVFF